MKIGVFGGSFDPPHLGHLNLAKNVQSALELDLVLWVPAGKNPLKDSSPIASGQHRLKMAQLMVAEEPAMAASDVELKRSGPSYAIHTLEELQLVMPGNYWLLMGGDSLDRFTEWFQWDRILRTTRIAAVIREGHDPALFERVQAELIQRQLDIVKIEPMGYSSTKLRAQVREGEHSPIGLSPEVAAYIAENNLYRG